MEQPIFWIAEFKIEAGRPWEETPVHKAISSDGSVEQARHTFWTFALELSQKNRRVVQWNFLNSDQGWYADGRDAKK